MRWRWLVVTLAVMLWAGCGAGFAQSTNSGDIRGIVTDTSGAAVPGVTVTVTNKNTGVSKDYVTNQDGLYDTSSIVAGTYELTFMKQGFQKYVRSNITVLVGNTSVNAKLNVGTVTQEVVVSTDVPLLKTDGGDQTTTLEAKSMSQLPEVGQDWQNFTILLPGSSGSPGFGNASNPGQVASVNGNLPYSTVLADGAAVTLPSSANADVMVLEDVQELQVSASAFSAQYGVGGIMFNQISKGGTDSFHGSAYEYLQNDAFDAANYAFKQKTRKLALSKVRYNNFGFSVGGPVIKKKLFFFFNYDKIINHGAASTGSTTVPDAGALTGDFTGPGYLTIYDPNTTVLTQATGTRPLPSDPSKTQTCPCYDRTSFAAEYGNGNRIPASRIDPVAKAIEAYYPKANQSPNSVVGGVSKNNYFYNVPNAAPFTKYFGRLDYDITGNNRLTTSVTESDNPAYSNGQGICPINCQYQDVSRINSQISDVWTISANTINELRLGYTNQLNFFVPASLGKGFPAKLGWQFAKADVFPNVNVGGYYGLASSTNAVYKEHAYDPSDVVTLVRGKHILHFGGEFLFFRDNSTAWGNLNAGTMGYTGAFTAETQGDSLTGLSYADFLLGQTQNWSAQETPEYGGRMRLPQMFVQDDYKVLPNLTLNLGLRYQIQTGWGEVKGNMATFDPTVQNPKSGTLGGLWFGSTHANGRTTLQKPVYNTLLPRVGFAWQFDPKSTLSGGFGLYAYNWSLDTYGGGMGGAFGQSGNITDQTNGVTPVVILSSSGSNLPYLSASTDPSKSNGQGVNYNPYDTPVGGSYQWNLSLQRELSNNMAVQLAYVASHGHNLPWNADANQIPESKLGPNDVALGYRPYPQYQGVSGYISHNAISNYNSFQASVQRRLTQGLEFNFNYVWAHFLDDMDSSGWGSRAGGQAYQNAYVISENYGNSNFDVRNAFKGSVVYQLPFGHGRQFLNNNLLLDEIIGGWQASGTIVAQSGQPFTVTMAKNNSYAQAGSWYPNVIGNAHLSSRGPYHGTLQWFNEAAFAQPNNGTFGNSGRNSLNGPGLSNVNFSLGKSFAIWEQVHLQVRADASNIFNHPSFGLPGSSLSVCAPDPKTGQLPSGCSASGVVQTGTSTINGVTIGGRSMQVGARLSF